MFIYIFSLVAAGARGQSAVPAGHARRADGHEHQLSHRRHYRQAQGASSPGSARKPNTYRGVVEARDMTLQDKMAADSTSGPNDRTNAGENKCLRVETGLLWLTCP